MPSLNAVVNGETSVQQYRIVQLRDSVARPDIIYHESFIGVPTDAVDIRHASGDLVFDVETGDICTDDGWLWDWEKNNPKSYAWRNLIASRARKERSQLPPWVRPSKYGKG